jgi:hypothetical protein
VRICRNRLIFTFYVGGRTTAVPTAGPGHAHLRTEGVLGWDVATLNKIERGSWLLRVFAVR